MSGVDNSSTWSTMVTLLSYPLHQALHSSNLHLHLHCDVSCSVYMFLNQTAYSIPITGIIIGCWCGTYSSNWVLSYFCMFPMGCSLPNTITVTVTVTSSCVLRSLMHIPVLLNMLHIPFHWLYHVQRQQLELDFCFIFSFAFLVSKIHWFLQSDMYFMYPHAYSSMCMNLHSIDCIYTPPCIWQTIIYFISHTQFGWTHLISMSE